jgi:hypothetical protein
MLGKRRCLLFFELAQPRELHRIDNHDRRLSVLGDGLRLAASGVDNGTESILGVLNGPRRTGHDDQPLARIYG